MSRIPVRISTARTRRGGSSPRVLLCRRGGRVIGIGVQVGACFYDVCVVPAVRVR